MIYEKVMVQRGSSMLLLTCIKLYLFLLRRGGGVVARNRVFSLKCMYTHNYKDDIIFSNKTHSQYKLYDMVFSLLFAQILLELQSLKGPCSL